MPLGDIRARLHHVMVLFEILPRLKQENLLKNLHENNLHNHPDMANFSNNYYIWRKNYKLFLEIDTLFFQLCNKNFDNCLLVELCKFLHFFWKLNLMGIFMNNFWTIAACQYITLIKTVYVDLININLYEFNWVTPKNLAQLIAWFLASHLKGMKFWYTKGWCETLESGAKHGWKKYPVNKDVVRLLQAWLVMRYIPRWFHKKSWKNIDHSLLFSLLSNWIGLPT
jgi:hypothetical protein